MILYTDTINGKQVLRDDMWAITTKEIDDLSSQIELAFNAGGEETATAILEKLEVEIGGWDCEGGVDELRTFITNLIT